ncbi:MAG TPA: FxLYD domain-containing protein [Candidatus Limnocylindria bacterium]|nr:FxLYD domain-containing protein [Candidatus Limnocylindria bacterium]
MSQNKFLKCACGNCGGKIEYPAEGIGSTIPCPHCSWPTELTLEEPASLVAEKSRTSKWVLAGVLILFLGVLGVVGALLIAPRLLKKARATQSASGALTTPVPVPAVQTINDFSISKVSIEKAPNSTLVYAAGALKNQTDKQRFGVTVELDLFDARGAKIGTTKDYVPIIEPRAEWKFRALAVQKNVASVRVTNVSEQQ